jgi:hypothetical protein
MVSFLKTNSSITLHYDGKTRVIAEGDARFDKVIGAIKANDLDAIPEIVEIEASLAKQGLDVQDGLVVVRGEPMPPELNERVLEYQRNGIPFKSLMRFWANLKQNPSFNSRQQLFKFLENKGHSITEDGCFIGYRGIRDDFKDCHSGTMDNSPGSVCEMPREHVDDNPDNTCSHGLHVGGYEYAKDFGANGRLVMVKVNPRDVVAVPNDYNGQKMRVCRFEVLKETTEFAQKPVLSEDGSDDIDYDDEWNEDSEDGVELNMHEFLIEDAAQRTAAAIESDMYSSPSISGLRKLLRYANNHNKRDKFGRFAKKKKKSKKTKRAKRS